MEKGKIFMNGKSQAVRLPKKFRFNTDEVLIQEHPAGILLIDPKKRWDQLEAMLNEGNDNEIIHKTQELKWSKRKELE